MANSDNYANVDATTLTERDHALFAFRLLLGREPESLTMYDNTTETNPNNILSTVIRSEEFRDRILTPMLAGERVIGQEFNRAPSSALKSWASSFPLTPETKSTLSSAKSWPELREKIFCDSVFYDEIIYPLIGSVDFSSLKNYDVRINTRDDIVNAFLLLLGREPEQSVIEFTFGDEQESFIEGIIISGEFNERVRQPMLNGEPVSGLYFDNKPPEFLKSWASKLRLSHNTIGKINSSKTWYDLHVAIFSDVNFRKSLERAQERLSELASARVPMIRSITRDDVVKLYHLTLGRDPDSEALIESMVGLDIVISIGDKTSSEEFEHRVRRPMLQGEFLTGPIFDFPPDKDLIKWCFDLPFIKGTNDSTQDITSWYQLHMSIFTSKLLHSLLGDKPNALLGLESSPPPFAQIKTVKKEIPENIRVNFPFTENFFSKNKWLNRQNPDVSIVILSFCRPDLVENLIRSIWISSFNYTYEIIIVDNGSPLGSHVLSHQIAQRCSVIRLNRNQYLGDAYNIGVERAKGEYVVLMNNDVVVDYGWLGPLIETIQQDDSVGAVGPKFLYPTGGLQEAGALIDNFGESIQLGKRGNQNSPEFNFVREVDYSTGATIATRRSSYLDLGGYDWRWSPGYYEDVDFCFKLRNRGLKTIYQPASSVFHIESATMQERPPSANMSDVVNINRRKFIKKWHQMLNRDTIKDVTPLIEFPNFSRFRLNSPVVNKNKMTVAVFFPYELIPGGGEKFALSIVEQFSDKADIYLVFSSIESTLRIISIVAELGFPDLAFQVVALDQMKDKPSFDYFFLIGNELFPVQESLGKRNFFICQFPFPISHERLSNYHQLGYYKSYESYIVYSDYVKRQVEGMLHRWSVEASVDVLSPTADMIGAGSDKANSVISVGRFFVGGHNKRHDVMVNAIASIVKKEPTLNVKLQLAGALHNAPEHRKHLSKLRELAETFPVTFEVDISRPSLNILYQEAKVYWHAGGWDIDINVNPEAVEHFGITILEAMSAGCIPIVYAAGGPAEIVNHGVNGFLVVSVEDMANYTIKVMRGWNTKLIKDIREEAIKTAARFNKDNFRSKMASIGILEEVNTNELHGISIINPGLNKKMKG